ncbi:DEAD/DEAH box helicase [Vagococcus xieshaowenii]|uniref:DEAD/DEAH box helicase n=1 Tax=Vagococcus xieshaowenii TaxID=2562451 RepID=A0AAJ5EG46_9ENTE|nr:DEAD/DEAH box helicase [Vagococcus xieshaowenii]QCA29296.1 DEAD/DEAH box helicase [Vagococcus xieshaowenii]TFZ42009.1 DEAD/DEAH box helicase [Vagococcus xieshaowenii]
MEINQLSQAWQEKWQAKNFQDPTAIQQKLYEPLKEGEHILGVSPTGTGKTIAYVLPLLERLDPNAGNQLLVLLPTQELAIQVTDVIREWIGDVGCSVQPIIGQANIKRQIEKLKDKPEVLVGTPGRVYELVQQKKIKAHLLTTIVLDEVDQLIAHSELNAAQNILKRLQQQTQLVGISATGQTVEAGFRDLVRRDFKLIDVTNDQGEQAADVLHGYIRTPLRKRGSVLKSLAHVEGMRAIVFFNEVQDMGSVSDKLTYEGVANASLASDQNKFARQRAIQAFHEKKVPFLLTTDLGARGLDFQEVDYVIHYDVPYGAESYIHRSGRTGRMNREGNVLTLLSDHQMKDLKNVSQKASADLHEVFLYGGRLSLTAPTKTAEPKTKPKKDKKESKSKKSSANKKKAKPSRAKKK